MLAWSCHKSGDYEESKEYGYQFLNIALEVENNELEAKACHVLSWSYHMIGDDLRSEAEELRSNWAAATIGKTYHSLEWLGGEMREEELPENI